MKLVYLVGVATFFTAAHSFASVCPSVKLTPTCRAGINTFVEEYKKESAVKGFKHNQYSYRNEAKLAFQTCGSEGYEKSLKDSLLNAQLARGKQEVLMIAKLRVEWANTAAIAAYSSALNCLQESLPEQGADLEELKLK